MRTSWRTFLRLIVAGRSHVGLDPQRRQSGADRFGGLLLAGPGPVGDRDRQLREGLQRGLPQRDPHAVGLGPEQEDLGLKRLDLAGDPLPGDFVGGHPAIDLHVPRGRVRTEPQAAVGSLRQLGPRRGHVDHRVLARRQRRRAGARPCAPARAFRLHTAAKRVAVPFQAAGVHVPGVVDAAKATRSSTCQRSKQRPEPPGQQPDHLVLRPPSAGRSPRRRCPAWFTSPRATSLSVLGSLPLRKTREPGTARSSTGGRTRSGLVPSAISGETSQAAKRTVVLPNGMCQALPATSR